MYHIYTIHFTINEKILITCHRRNLLYQISNMSQSQQFSSGDLTSLKIILSMTNSHKSLEFSPITYHLPSVLFEIIPSSIVSILAKWNSISIGPQLKVSNFIFSIELFFFINNLIICLYIYYYVVINQPPFLINSINYLLYRLVQRHHLKI